MSFSQDNGYTPVTFDSLMEGLRLAINSQFSTDYTEESFEGTNWYKYFYGLVQKVQENDVKTSEIFTKLQNYIATTNDRIQRPSVSFPGILDSFADNGYVAAVKKNEIGDAGTISICVLVDDSDPDYEDTKLEICTLISEIITAGMITTGSETEQITLSNGQDFDFKYHLPDPTPVKLKLTLTTSDNANLLAPSDEDIRQLLYTQINARYQLGWDFEPQRYFTLEDAPWAATAILEWSDDDEANWHDEVFEAAFDDLFTFSIEDIAIAVDV